MAILFHDSIDMFAFDCGLEHQWSVGALRTKFKLFKQIQELLDPNKKHMIDPSLDPFLGINNAQTKHPGVTLCGTREYLLASYVKNTDVRRWNEAAVQMMETIKKHLRNCHLPNSPMATVICSLAKSLPTFSTSSASFFIQIGMLTNKLFSLRITFFWFVYLRPHFLNK